MGDQSASAVAVVVTSALDYIVAVPRTCRYCETLIFTYHSFRRVNGDRDVRRIY